MTAASYVQKLTARSAPSTAVMAVAAVVAVLPAVTSSNYLLHIAVLVFVYIMLGLGLATIVGLAGLLDLGYVAFYAVGAYSYALLNTKWDIPFVVALPIGGVLASLFAIAVGWPTVRTRGDYLALVTLGFGEMVRLVIRNADGVTNGPRGIMGIDPPAIGTAAVSTPFGFFYVALALALATVFLFRRLDHSEVGRHLAAIRDDEDAAAVIGVRPLRWKLYAFGVGAFVAGVAGVFFASWQRFVSPESFTLNESILILSIVVLGGMGRMWPTIIAAVLMVLLPEVLRGFETGRLLMMGFALVVVILIEVRTAAARRAKIMAQPRRQLGTSTVARPITRTEPDSGSDQDIVRVKGVAKSFGGIKALEDASFSIREGEIAVLIGVNGAGKSTLFTCMTGPTRIDAGRIEMRNGSTFRRIDTLEVFERARFGIVRTHSQPRLFESLSSGTNILLGAACHHEPTLWEPLTRSRSRVNPTDILESLDAPGASTPTSELTFVEQKLVEIARAMATRPRVLLLDEPAAGMEPERREKLAQWILDARRTSGTTFVVVEHDLVFARSIADRFLILDGGRIAAAGRPDDAAVAACLRSVYEG